PTIERDFAADGAAAKTVIAVFAGKLLPSRGRGRFELAASRNGAFQFSGRAPVVHDEVHKEHQHKDSAESDDNGRAGGRIENDAREEPRRENRRASAQAEGEARADAVGKEHRAHAGNNQVAENQQYASDGYGRGDYKTERSVEEKVPEAHVHPRLLRFTVV